MLGLNARNLLYIKPFNPRKAIALADDKMKTKAFLAARGVPVAKVYARIESRKQLAAFDFSSLPDECVLKPNYGFGGEGILILKGRKNGMFLEQGKRPIPQQELVNHIEDILDGKFSVNGRADTAFFEKILIGDPCFAPFLPAGLPDIRIIVFNLVPVMAMLRIPTAQSGGKANVHLGGIGVGIDIAKGVTTHATQFNRLIRTLPHGGSPSGHIIPHWDELLLISSRIQYHTNIGYLAVDLTIDAEQGPVLLEVNARAGLMVQVANLAPLRTRLERIGGIRVSSPEKGVRMAQDLFGEKLKRADEEEEDRTLISTHEVLLFSGDGIKMEVPCLVAPDRERTEFSEDLIGDLEQAGIVEETEEGSYRVRFTLAGQKVQTVVRSGKMPDSAVRAVIGRRDLTGFLIDPSKALPRTMRSSVKDDLRAIDRFLSQTDSELLLLKYLKPINLREERVRLEEDKKANPLFLYRPLPEHLAELYERLAALSPDESPLGLLLAKKKQELLQKIELLHSIGKSEAFTRASASLFGSPGSSLLTAAAATLRAQTACEMPSPPDRMVSAEEAVSVFESALLRYGLHEWKVSVRRSLVADCTVGAKNIYLREGASFSPEHLNSLIAHEIETHVIIAENGEHQPYEILRRGCANYLDTQEGLAVFNQNRVLSEHHEKRYGPARTVLAIAFALTHSFTDTRAYLEEELGYRSEKALSKAIDVKRGLMDASEHGAFTKGLAYFRGLSAIEGFVANGGDLKRLYIGKIAIEDLSLIEQIEEVKAPIILPAFLREEEKAGKKKGAKKTGN